MSFAALSVLTMVVRQILGGQMTKFDTFVARTWVQLGFMITFGSIVPPLLGLFEVSTPVVWRISSGLMAIILGWWALTFPRRRASDEPIALATAGYNLLGSYGCHCARARRERDCPACPALAGRLCCIGNCDTCWCRDVVPVRVRASAARYLRIQPDFKVVRRTNARTRTGTTSRHQQVSQLPMQHKRPASAGQAGQSRSRRARAQ